MGKLAPIVEIDLDKPRHLKFDLNAMVEYERATGQSLATADIGSTQANLRALLWAALVHEDAALTIEQVGAMTHPGNMAEVNAALLTLFADTFSSDTDAPKAPEAMPRRSIGKRSGR